jgi:predicted permease
MILLVCGGLVIKSFVRLTNVPLGYDPASVVTFQVALPDGVYRGARIQAFAEDLVARLGERPRVEAAAYAPLLPMVKLLENHVEFGATPRVSTAAPSERVDFRGVSHDYFRAMGIRVLNGRGFSALDTADRPHVVVINRTAARRHFAGVDPIGRLVYLQNRPDPWQVVGVIDDVRQVGFGQVPEPQVFVDSRQWPGMAPGLRFLQYFAVRTSGDPLAVVPQVRGVLREIEPRAALYNVAAMDQIVSNLQSQPRLYAVLAAFFGIVAATLAAIGIYGLLAYTVSQRTREIGIRVALGARRAETVGLIVRQSMKWTVGGLLIGIAGAAVASRFIDHLLFDVAPLDYATFGAAGVIFIAVAATASVVPAWRAAQVDPVITLRMD